MRCRWETANTHTNTNVTSASSSGLGDVSFILICSEPGSMGSTGLCVSQAPTYSYKEPQERHTHHASCIKNLSEQLERDTDHATPGYNCPPTPFPLPSCFAHYYCSWRCPAFRKESSDLALLTFGSPVLLPDPNNNPNPKHKYKVQSTSTVHERMMLRPRGQSKPHRSVFPLKRCTVRRDKASRAVVMKTRDFYSVPGTVHCVHREQVSWSSGAPKSS
jgi:hypothetical protein